MKFTNLITSLISNFGNGIFLQDFNVLRYFAEITFQKVDKLLSLIPAGIFTV